MKSKMKVIRQDEHDSLVIGQNTQNILQSSTIKHFKYYEISLSVLTIIGLTFMFATGIYYYFCRLQKVIFNTWISNITILVLSSVLSIIFIVALILSHWKSKQKWFQITFLVVIGFQISTMLLILAQFTGNWGPIVMPIDKGSQIVIYTFIAQKIKINVTHNGITTEYKSYGRKHHFFIPHRQFDLKYNGNVTTYNIDKLNSFVFISDNHNQPGLEKIKIPNLDLIVSAGDNTNDGMLQDYYGFFDKYQKPIPFLTAMGNHDRRLNEDIYGFDALNYYTNIDGIGFYFINVYTRALDAQITKDEVDIAIRFLNTNIRQTDEMRILVVHETLFPQAAKDRIYYAHQIEIILDKFDFEYVLCGDVHVFTYFKRKNVKIITGSTAGASTNRFYPERFSNEFMQYYITSIDIVKTYVLFTKNQQKFDVKVYNLETNEMIYQIE